MNPGQFLALIAFAKTLGELIEFGFDQFRKKGELTPELEAAYQAHQAEVYARPSAQPEAVSDTPPLPGPHTVADATKPDV
jgi:hypothetical protein